MLSLLVTATRYETLSKCQIYVHAKYLCILLIILFTDKVYFIVVRLLNVVGRHDGGAGE